MLLSAPLLRARRKGFKAMSRTYDELERVWQASHQRSGNFNWLTFIMLALKRNRSKPEASPGKVKLRWEVLFRDLGLFTSLTVARLIVWLTLRRRRQERTARRKRLKLIQSSDHHAGQRVVPS
jgi:hypothetical protein